MTHDFLAAWGNWRDVGPPHRLPDDSAVLDRLLLTGRAVVHASWDAYVAEADRVADPEDQRLHLGLIPQPFFGDPLTARVVVLTLNPGLNPHDYFAEYRVHGFREQLIANLRRTLDRYLSVSLWNSQSTTMSLRSLSALTRLISSRVNSSGLRIIWRSLAK